MCKIEGKVLVVGGTETVGSKGFKKRLLVVETADQYPQQIPIEFVQDKTDLLNGISVGQSVSVQINLRGNEYNGKYYANIQGWKIENSSVVSDNQSQSEPPF